MPPKNRSKKKGSTGPKYTDSSQGEAAAAGGNTIPADVVALPSEETANLLPTGGELKQVASTVAVGANYESGASNASGGNDSPPADPVDDSWMNDDFTIAVPTSPQDGSILSKENGGK